MAAAPKLEAAGKLPLAVGQQGWQQTGLFNVLMVSLVPTEIFQKVYGDKDADVAFICRSGGRSAAARDQLLEAGYESVTRVTGGTPGEEGWIASGLPVRK